VSLQARYYQLALAATIHHAGLTFLSILAGTVTAFVREYRGARRIGAVNIPGCESQRLR
jgi:hypothetical protein